MTAFSIMIIDDDREMRESLVHFLTMSKCTVTEFSRAQAALDALVQGRPDAIVSDVRMPGMTGLELLAAVKQRHADVPVILISAHGDVPMAVEAMQAGAYSFLEKPFDPQRLHTIIAHAAEAHRLTNQNRRLRARLSEASGLTRVLIGDAKPMNELREDILDVSDTDAAVLILGETGTGKEVVARALHDLSGRADAPFMAVNCAAIPENLFEASMFGHVAGAFTGAEKASDGYFVGADGGTLFLDELGACPLEHQAKLLRAIETREVTPVGSTRSKHVDIRFVAATNEGLEEAVREGRFREDLFYRLNTFELHLPPLRQRREDIPLLFTHFLDLHGRAYDCAPPVLTAEDISTLMAHDWPGNVRELRHLAERRILTARRGRGSVAEAMRSDALPETDGTLKDALNAYERMLIIEALKKHGGRMDDTAVTLGISRRTLNEKLVKLGIKRDTYTSRWDS